MTPRPPDLRLKAPEGDVLDGYVDGALVALYDRSGQLVAVIDREWLDDYEVVSGSIPH